MDSGHLMIVEPSAPNLGRIDAETKWVDEVQLAARIGRQPDDIAGIGWDFGFEKDDMEHGFESVISKAIIYS